MLSNKYGSNQAPGTNSQNRSGSYSMNTKKIGNHTSPRTNITQLNQQLMQSFKTQGQSANAGGPTIATSQGQARPILK